MRRLELLTFFYILKRRRRVDLRKAKKNEDSKEMWKKEQKSDWTL
jgi:hypothetical protein